MAERTVHQLTQDFNQLAEEARKRGVAMWAKHHSSDFSSRRVAEEQLARLRKAMDLPVPITQSGFPDGKKRVLEVALQLPADDLVIAGPSVDWTATARGPDGVPIATHRSLASDWFIAMMLAVAHWRKTKAVPPREEVTIHLERK